MLTPLDVKRQQFTKQKLGGYDPEQVHAFLERVATELESEKEKQRSLESRAKDLENKLEHYERVELALQEALETARETARVAKEAAEKRARVVLDEAELRAQKIVRDAEVERHSLRQDLDRVSTRQREVTAKMRAFLLSELELLAKFEGDDPVGFLKLETSSGGSRQLAAGFGDEGDNPAREEPEAGNDVSGDLFEAMESSGEDETADETKGREGETESGTLSEGAQSGMGDPGVAAEFREETGEEKEERVSTASSRIEGVAEEPEIDWEAVSDLGTPGELTGDVESEEETYEEVGSDVSEVAESDASRSEEPSADSRSGAQTEDEEGASVDSGAWNLHTLLQGEKGESGSDTERERIRRILEDLD